MNWLFLTLGAQVTYTVNIFFDKYIIESRLPDYRSLPIFTSLLAGIVAAILSIFFTNSSLGLFENFMLLISGMFVIWGFSFYIEALLKEETSVIIILIQLIPVMVLVFSFFFLGEVLSLKQYFGFALLLFSAIFISLKKQSNAIWFSQGLVFILIADLLWAIPYVLVKYVSQTNEVSFQSLLFLESCGVFLGGGLLYLLIKNIRHSFNKTLKKISRLSLGLIFLNEIFYLIAKVLSYFAVTLGPVTLVTVVGSTQIFFGILFGLILTFISPKVFKEDLSLKTLTKKVGLALLSVLGIYLIS